MSWCSHLNRLSRILRRPSKPTGAKGKIVSPMTDYFDQNFQPYRNLLDNRYYLQSAESALNLLKQFRSANPSRYSTEHKGSPFYVLGYLSFSANDYPGGSLFFDAAVSADIAKFGASANKPALNFLRLDTAGQDMLASEIIRDVLATVTQLVTDYSARTGATSITVAELRTHFFERIIQSSVDHERALLTAFISFIAEWNYRSQLIELVEKGSREPFFLHLFRGCLLFESILKCNIKRPMPRPRMTLKPVINLLPELNLVGAWDTGADDFDTDVVQKLRSGLTVTGTVELTGRARNTLGHTLVWETPSLTKQKYDLLVDTICMACIHSISTTHR